MKIYEKLIANLDKIGDEIFIKEMLLEYNLWRIFSPIYASNKEVQHGNICTSFIILCYSNGCMWLDHRKDRREVKVDILESIIKLSKTKIDDKINVLIGSLIDGSNFDVDEVLYGYIDWQKNDLFNTFIGLSNQISLCNKESSITYGVNAKVLNDRGKFLENIENLMSVRDRVLDRIEKEYQGLDESLKQEGKTPISKRMEGPASWEERIKTLTTHG